MTITNATRRVGISDTTRQRLRVLAWPCLVLGALVIVQGLHAMSHLDDMLLYEDSAQYMVLARSLVSGDGYRQMSSPGSPAHVLFPPGLPAALAGLRLAGASGIIAAKVFILLVGLAAAPATYLLLRPRVGDGIATLLGAWLALHPDYLRAATTLSADAPYVFLSLVALLAIRASARQRGWRDWAGVTAWLATTIAVLTRTVGLALVAVAPVYLAWGKTTPDWRKRVVALAILTAAYAGPPTAWEWWKAAHPSAEHGGYVTLLQRRNEYDWDMGKVSGFGDIADRYVRNARRYVRGLGSLIVGAGSDRQRSFTGVALGVLIVGGMAVAVRGGSWLIEAYLALTALATLAHPTPQLPRYLLPMLPFVLLYPALLISMPGGQTRRGTQIVLAACVVAALATHDLRGQGREAALRPAYLEYRATARWLRAHTPPGTVVLCRKPVLMYLWSDRKSVAFPFSRDLKLIDGRVARDGVTHVVADSISERTAQFLLPWISRRLNGRIPTHTNGSTRVWQLTASHQRHGAT